MSRHGAMVQSGGGGGSSSSSNYSNSSKSNVGGWRYTVVVFEAETGKRLDVQLPEGQQDGTDSLRRELFRLTGVPPENQILLCGGPPYKPLRSHLPPGVAVATSATAGTSTNSADTNANTDNNDTDANFNTNRNDVDSTATTATATASDSASAAAAEAPAKRKRKTNNVYLFDWRTLAPERSAPSSPPAAAAAAAAATAGADSTVPSVFAEDGVSPSPVSQTSSSSQLEGAAVTAATVAAAALREAEAVEVAEFAGAAEVRLPTEPGAAPSPLPSAEGSVLLATIANYERGSMLAFDRGQAYFDSSARRLKGGLACVDRMQNQMEALDAAISNSLDHWEPLQRVYTALKERLQEQAVRHEGMLQTFEKDVATLGTIPLHPALALPWAKPGGGGGGGGNGGGGGSGSGGGSGNDGGSAVVGGGNDASGGGNVVGDGGSGGGGGRVSTFEERSSRRGLEGEESEALGGTGLRSVVRGPGGLPEPPPPSPSHQQQHHHKGATGTGAGAGGGAGRATLLDCVPVEREKKLLESCRTSQRRFRQEAEAVAQKYAAIKRGIEEQRGDPVVGDVAVKGLLERARGLCAEQESRVAELEANYLESFNRASKENWTDDKEKQDAIQRMTELTVAQENIVPVMKANDLQVMDSVAEIARAKAALSRTLRRRLREVSKLQTDIGKIQKHQELVGMAWGQKEEQFEHLGKVARMPAAYDAFVLEVLRRRRYHEDFVARVADFSSSMNALRSAEIAFREGFRQTHLGNLPPVFLEMAPGLRNAPPAFEPPLVARLEPGELPEIYPEVGPVKGLPPGEKEPNSGNEGVGGSVNSRVVSPSAAETADSAEAADSAPESAAAAAAVSAASAAADSAAATSAAAATRAAEEREEEGEAAEKESETEEGEEAPREAEGGASVADAGIIETAAAGVDDGREGAEASAPAESGVAVGGGEGGDPKLGRVLAVEAENARLVTELADARARLERFVRDAHANRVEQVVEEVGVGVADKDDGAVGGGLGGPATATGSPSSEQGGVSVGGGGEKEGSVVPTGGGDTPADSAGEVTAAVAVAVAAAASPVAPVGETLSEVDGKDATTTTSIHKGGGGDGGGGVGERSRRSFSDATAVRGGSDGGGGGGGGGEVGGGRGGGGGMATATTTAKGCTVGGGAISGGRRGSGAVASGRRGLTSSKEATQSQLAAYRAGLSMLVKLADQLAVAAAAAAVTGGGGGGGGGGVAADVSARACWETSPPGRTSSRRALLDEGAPMAPRGAEAASTALASASAVTTQPVSGAGDAPAAGDASSTPADAAADAAAVAVAVVDKSTRIPGEPEITPLSPATDKGGSEGGSVGSGGGGGGDGGGGGGGGRGGSNHGGVAAAVAAAAAADELPGGEGQSGAGEVDGEGGSPSSGGKGPDADAAAAVAAAAATMVDAGTAGLKREEGGEELAGDNASPVPSPSADDLRSETAAATAAVPAAAAAAVVAVTTEDVSVALKSSARGPAASVEPSAETSALASGTAAGAGAGAGAGAAEGGGGGVGAGGKEGAVVRAGTTRSVDRIKRAAEHVATHLRRSHERIEELLAFEALAAVPRISMCSFDVQDIALFLPTMVGPAEGSGGPVFLAFHVNCPNRYLSEESINNARQNLGSSPAYILGRIILVEQHVATEEPNPYNVASKTVYYVLTAENVC